MRSDRRFFWTKVWDFETVDGARAAEDHLLARAHAQGHGSKDGAGDMAGICHAAP